MQFAIHEFGHAPWLFSFAWGVLEYASTNQIPSKTIEKFFTNDDVRKKIDQSSHIIYYKTFGKLGKILTKYFYGEASPKGKVS